ncbi:MAG: hypothetical protein ABH956_00725 [Candidatus Nealsonbacteria bacterium]
MTEEKKQKIEEEIKELRELAGQIKEYTHQERRDGFYLDVDFYKDYGQDKTERDIRK